jgi:hypothetical protein
MGVILLSAQRFLLSIHDVMGLVADDTKYANDPLTRPPCLFSLLEAQLLFLASVQYPQRYAVDGVIEH